MCVCIYIHIYLYIYTHTHTHIHTYIHTYVSLHTHEQVVELEAVCATAEHPPQLPAWVGEAQRATAVTVAAYLPLAVALFQGALAAARVASAQIMARGGNRYGR